MTPLSEIALAFAHECMGWQECRPSKMHQNTIMGIPPGEKDRERFCFGSLDHVMPEIRTWVDEHRCYRLQIFSVHGRQAQWEVAIYGPGEAHDAEDTDLCRALMLACLGAARKLKERAA